MHCRDSSDMPMDLVIKEELIKDYKSYSGHRRVLPPTILIKKKMLCGHRAALSKEKLTESN